MQTACLQRQDGGEREGGRGIWLTTYNGDEEEPATAAASLWPGPFTHAEQIGGSKLTAYIDHTHESDVEMKKARRREGIHGIPLRKFPLLLSEERKMLRILSSVTMAARGQGFRARAGRDGWVWRWKEEGAVVATVNRCVARRFAVAG